MMNLVIMMIVMIMVIMMIMMTMDLVDEGVIQESISDADADADHFDELIMRKQVGEEVIQQWLALVQRKSRVFHRWGIFFGRNAPFISQPQNLKKKKQHVKTRFFLGSFCDPV